MNKEYSVIDGHQLITIDDAITTLNALMWDPRDGGDIKEVIHLLEHIRATTGDTQKDE